MKEVLPWLVQWLVVLVQEFFFCLGCSSRPSTNYFFFLTVHDCNSFVPIDQQVRQTALLGRLSLSICLYSKLSASSVKIFLNIFILKKVCLGKRCYLEHVLYLLVPSKHNDITVLVMLTVAYTVLLVMLMACKPTDCTSGCRMRCGVTIYL
jgi:hypothetical protein